MKHALIVAALLFAGCGKKSDSGPSCESAIDKALAAMPGGPGGGDEIKGKLKPIYVKHCTDDKWSADVKKCYANDVKDMSGMKACRGKLTQEQQDKVMQDVRSTMMGAMGGMGGPGMGGPHGGMGGAGPAGGAMGGAGAPPADPNAAGGAAPAGSAAAPAGSATP
jgi:hypothetical protein